MGESSLGTIVSWIDAFLSFPHSKIDYSRWEAIKNLLVFGAYEDGLVLSVSFSFIGSDDWYRFQLDHDYPLLKVNGWIEGGTQYEFWWNRDVGPKLRVAGPKPVPEIEAWCEKHGCKFEFVKKAVYGPSNT